MIHHQALKRNPRDSLLAAKMGQALQKTHQYGKALNYYKEAVKDEDNNNLRYDMAELQMRLKTYDRAEKTIQAALELENNGNDLNSLIMQAKFHTLLAKVYEKSNNLDMSIETLGQVRVRIHKSTLSSVNRRLNCYEAEFSSGSRLSSPTPFSSRSSWRPS